MNTLTNEVRQAAKTVARGWDGVVEADDVEQEIWVYLLEKRQVYAIQKLEEQHRRNLLRRIGTQISQQHRADYEAFTGNFLYSTDDVRAILEKASGGTENRVAGVFVCRPGDGHEGIADDMDTPGSEVHAEQMDLEQALSPTTLDNLTNGFIRLRDSNPDYVDVIHRYYMRGESFTDAEHVKLTRARDALTREMNGYHREAVAAHDGPKFGGRKP